MTLAGNIPSLVSELLRDSMQLVRYVTGKVSGPEKSVPFITKVAGQRRGIVVSLHALTTNSGVRRMNEVNAHRERFVLGQVTVFERVYHLGM